MAKRKVILFLVEGTSDLTALVQPFAAYFQNRANVEGEAFHCDVTTVSLFPRNATFRVFRDVKETVRGFVLDQIERRHLYRWTDLERMVHVVDLDGAFIPDHCVIQDPAVAGTTYRTDSIVTSNRDAMLLRNDAKRRALHRLVSSGSLTFNRKPVPYQVFFMSRNLEHALFGIERDLDESVKERLSQAFVEKCRLVPSTLPDLLRSQDVHVQGDYDSTWKFIQQGTNSLHRGTNIALLLDRALFRS